MAVRYAHKDADREMLEQPGAHDVGGDLRKDAAFLLPLGGAVRLGVFVGGAVTGPVLLSSPSPVFTADHSTRTAWHTVYFKRANL